MRASIFFGLAVSTLALAGGESKDNSATAISAAKADTSGKGGNASAEAAAAAQAKGGNASAQAAAAAQAKGGRGGSADATASASADASSKGGRGGNASASAEASASASANGRGGRGNANASASASASASANGSYDPKHHHGYYDPSDPCTTDDGSDSDSDTDCDEWGKPRHLGWWHGRYYGLYDPSCGFDYGVKKYWVFDPKTCIAPVKVVKVKPVHVAKSFYTVDPPCDDPKVIIFWTQIPGCHGPRCWRKNDWCDGDDCCHVCYGKHHYPPAPWGCCGDDCYDDGHGGCRGVHCCHGDRCNPVYWGNKWGGSATAVALSSANASGKNANAAAFSAASATGKNANALAASAAQATGKNANAVAGSIAQASS